MKKAKSVALIGAGKLSTSPVSEFWRLSDRLGPVKAPSFRLASRIANRLRAGHPVRDYAEFDSCRLILVSVPDAMLPAVVGEISSANISWRNKSIVLCSALLDSGELSDLASRGASIGSISVIPGFEAPHYLVEGDPLAILESKRLVRDAASPANLSVGQIVNLPAASVRSGRSPWTRAGRPRPAPARKIP